jgi:hypothetical protein
MRADLCISYDDNEGKYYLNFDKIMGNHMGVETGGYIQVEEHEDGDITIVVVDKEGNVVDNIVTTVSRMIGGE